MLTKKYVQEELARRIDGIRPNVPTNTDVLIGELKSALMLVDCLPDDQPLPEDTVLFNKGVAEGRRLESEENKDRDIVFWRGIQYAKEQMLNDGLDAVKTLDFNKVEKTIAGVFVKYGMDRQKEMMMEEAVEGYVTLTLTGVRTVAATIKEEDNIGFGDKVRVIILPKEGEK